MNDSNTLAYLWDPSTTADNEIAALEQVLAPARLAAPVPAIRSLSPVGADSSSRHSCAR